MCAAFFAPGEALVDTVTVGLVGYDENAAVGGCGGSREQDHAGKSKERDRTVHRGMRRSPPFDKPKILTMVNHGARGRFGGPNRPFPGLTRSPRLAHGVPMNGFLAICSICREIMS